MTERGRNQNRKKKSSKRVKRIIFFEIFLVIGLIL